MAKQNKSQIDKHDIPISIQDLYTIGIGPSSSHTVGPMRAGLSFANYLVQTFGLDAIAKIQVEVYGSLALTGRGHATDIALYLGLTGYSPEKVDPAVVSTIVQEIKQSGKLHFLEKKFLPFRDGQELIFNETETLPQHPNAMKFEAWDTQGQLLISCHYFSVGGGFITGDKIQQQETFMTSNTRVPYPFSSAKELLEIGQQHHKTIADIMLENEHAWRNEEETHTFIDKIHHTMMGSIQRGYHTVGTLPGGLNIQRRAPAIYQELTKSLNFIQKDPLIVMDWVSLYALAVNEENAAGGRVVTAPTNGAAGIIPAVLKYYETFCQKPTRKGIHDLLLTAAAIGTLYKKRASISGAEMGCQGEVGVACSMAAAGLASALGGTNEQIENAAEIGMEHNLGLTCDPVGGLVQVPCIERNTMGAIKAINATRLALRGNGQHLVSLDTVIETMRQTGEDMQSKYKETSQGGLAVNVVEC